MRISWLAQGERSNVFVLRLMLWATFCFGRTASRLLLFPISVYFAVFSVRARTASRNYLQRVFRRPVSFTDVVRHYLSFAATIHDRIYLLSGRYGDFDVRLHGDDALDAELANGRGCILLGSHLGSFEVLRARGSFENRAPINVLMYENNASKINQVLYALNPEIHDRVIPLGTPMTLVRAKECLERGEMVGILGDRAIRGGRSCRCDFLGAPAWIPEGPLLLASILHVPVYLFFGLYRGGRRYDIYIEPFATELAVRRTHRSEDIAPWVMRYTARLEHYCRLAPYNWFNFFDFWQSYER
jgi:predicted LPLAT superfamily acyltransferase